MEQLDDAHRAVYRSRHLFLILIALVNLGLGQIWRNGRFQRLLSSTILLAPVLLLAAFVFEPGLGIEGRAHSTVALYALFGAASTLAITGKR